MSDYLPFNSARYSPDATCVATSSWDRTVRVVDADTGQQLVRLDFSTEIADALFTSDGSRLLCAPDGHSASLWDLRSLSLLRRFGESDNPIARIAISSDDRYVIAATHGHEILIWDSQTGTLVRRIPAHEDHIRDVAIVSDAGLIASASHDGTCRLWNCGTGDLEFEMRGSDIELFTSVDLSHDGALLVAGSVASTVSVWNTVNGKRVHRLVGHTGLVSSVSFSPDSKCVLSASSDGSVRLFSVGSGREVQKWTVGAWVARAVLKPDCARILTAAYDGTARVWDVRTGIELFRIESDPYPGSSSARPEGESSGRVVAELGKVARGFDRGTDVDLDANLEFGAEHRLLEAEMATVGHEMDRFLSAVDSTVSIGVLSPFGFHTLSRFEAGKPSGEGDWSFLLGYRDASEVNMVLLVAHLTAAEEELDISWRDRATDFFDSRSFGAVGDSVRSWISEGSVEMAAVRMGELHLVVLVSVPPFARGDARGLIRMLPITISERRG